jgi:hypothetical protein
MRVLVFGQGKTGTTVIAKTIQHSISGANFLMEPKSEFEIAVGQNNATVTKILYGQWKRDSESLDRVLRNQSDTCCFDKLIKIIRDPRDQAISFFFYNFYDYALSPSISDNQLRELLSIVRNKEISPQSISFATLCDEVNRVHGWKRFTSTWLIRDSGIIANKEYWEYLKSINEGYLCRYEDFMRGNVDGLEDYLGLTLSTDRSVDEFSRTCRSAASENWREFFTEEDIHQLRPVCESLLNEMGYPDWELKPIDRLSPAHFSSYLLGLIRAVRGAQWQ